MTKQHQKLYDKLLKKVNEYCLGAAAEDVIAAIDALVVTDESVQEGKPKYIRTKDGQIIDINRTVRTNNILKKAATIEELCDEFLAIDIGIFETTTRTYKTIEEACEDHEFLFDEFYGIVNGKKVAKYNTHENKFELLKEVLK